MLNEGMNRKLTIVTAPAGYGKITLLSLDTLAAGEPDFV